MKKISTLIMIGSIFFMFSCKSDTNSTDKANETKTSEVVVENKGLENGEYVVSISKSNIAWSAEGVGHGHNGTVGISAGKFIVKDGQFNIGKMNIDLTKMTCTDIADAGKNKDLIDHLLGKDFFNVSEFPTANIGITDASDLTNVKAALTIKGVTNDVVFPMVVSKKDGNVVVTAMLTIDRTKYGVKYNSKNFFKNLGNYMIEDEISFKINLVAAKK